MSRPRHSPRDADDSAPATPAFARQQHNNRSLERGLHLLRAFSPGVNALSNSELAERVGLPRSTVSRLTQTLVQERFLDYVPEAGVYRLGPPLLSLGLAMQQSSELFHIAQPLMGGVAEGRRINVGLAVRDGTDMVYLTSIRKSRSEMFRHVTSGSRIPMALTALGRAHLSTLVGPELTAMLSELQAKHPVQWPERKREIQAAIAKCRAEGYCSATWQTGIVSVAAPLRGHAGYAFNVSVLIGGRSMAALVEELAQTLLQLMVRVNAALK
ncbi:helix-turn-helix domain-containing protein [Variovorax sp. J22P271]|nr:helix-turn-helix domain-containing protein [Variovorax sp. J22P271]